MNLLLMPMWIVSGAVFPVREAHPLLRTLMIINPLTYGVDGFRQALYGSSPEGDRGLWPMWLCLVNLGGVRGGDHLGFHPRGAAEIRKRPIAEPVAASIA